MKNQTKTSIIIFIAVALLVGIYIIKTPARSEGAQSHTETISLEEINLRMQAMPLSLDLERSNAGLSEFKEY